MALEQSIFKGAGSNYSIRYEVTSSDVVAFDLDDVASATFRVLRPPDEATGGQDQQTWTTVLDPDLNRTSTFLVLEHSFGVPGEIDERVGRYVVEPRMTTSGGEVRAEPVSFLVRGDFEL